MAEFAHTFICVFVLPSRQKTRPDYELAAQTPDCQRSLNHATPPMPPMSYMHPIDFQPPAIDIATLEPCTAKLLTDTRRTMREDEWVETDKRRSKQERGAHRNIKTMKWMVIVQAKASSIVYRCSPSLLPWTKVVRCLKSKRFRCV